MLPSCTWSDTSSVKMISPPPYCDSCVELGFSFASRKRACANQRHIQELNFVRSFLLTSVTRRGLQILGHASAWQPVHLYTSSVG